ncbi:hypothetical protein Tco_0213291 [Tanacetum coccineum]
MPRWPSRREEVCGELEFTRSSLQVKMRGKVDPPKGTLVSRVQLATVADEVVAKRRWYLALNWSSRSQENSAPC